MRATAFMTRSIRQDSRTLSHHLMRAGVAVLILLLLSSQLMSSRMQIGAGGQFAAQVFRCCYWFLTLLGGVHFSAAISEEKEEQTLPLLKMTGASAIAILLGKSLPRLAIALLFLLCVAPFLLLSVTLGGVLSDAMISSILSVLCYSLMLCQLGLLASLLASTTRQAFGIFVLFWSLTELLCLWVGLLGSLEIISPATYETWWAASYSWSLIMNLTSTLLAFSAVGWWQPHMTFQLVVAGCSFFASWLLFNRCTEERPAGSTFDWNQSLSSAGHSSRVWDNALEWKTWHVLAGGWRWTWIRMIGGIATSFGLMFVFWSVFESSLDLTLICVGSFWIALVLFLLSVGRMVGRVFQEEIQQKTLSALVMLPAPTDETFIGLLKGLIPAVAASFVPVAFGFVAMNVSVSSVSNGRPVFDYPELFVEPWFFHFFTWALLTFVLGMYFSTKFRHGAVLIAIGLLWFIAPMFFSMFFGLLLGVIFRSPGAEPIMRYLLPMMLMALEVFLCFGLVRATFTNLKQIASR